MGKKRKSRTWAKEAPTAGANPGFCSMKLIGTFRYGDYGLRLDARFSLAETLGRVHNEWRENAKLRPQTTDNRLRTKSEGQLYAKQIQSLF